MTKEKFSAVTSGAEKVFSSNPVLVSGLVLGPVVMCASSLKNAAALSIAFALIIIPVLLFASTAGRALPAPARIPAYVLLAAAMLIPIEMLVSYISPIIFDALGIYLPLLAVNSVVVAYTGRAAEKEGPAAALMDGVFFSLGFALAVGLLGLVREFLGSGSLWGVAVSDFKASAALLPFSGFILLGFMAAAIQGIKGLVKKGRGVNSAGGKGDEA